MRQPEFRIYEMNKRLWQRTEVIFIFTFYISLVTHFSIFVLIQESDNLWWDAFATEFFEDDATLTVTFYLEDGPKRYCKFFV